MNQLRANSPGHTPSESRLRLYTDPQLEEISEQRKKLAARIEDTVTPPDHHENERWVSDNEDEDESYDMDEWDSVLSAPKDLHNLVRVTIKKNLAQRLADAHEEIANIDDWSGL